MINWLVLKLFGGVIDDIVKKAENARYINSRAIETNLIDAMKRISEKSQVHDRLRLIEGAVDAIEEQNERIIDKLNAIAVSHETTNSEEILKDFLL